MARVCVDSNYFDVDDDGRLTLVRGSLGYQETITVLGTLAPITFEIANYPLVNWLFVEAVGGGGSGSGAIATASAVHGAVGGGGSGGTYCASWIRASTLPAVVIAAGGAGGAPSFDDGNDGGPSSFGSLVVAPGGIGANEIYGASTTATYNPGAPAGAIGTGQTRKQGQPGQHGVMANVNFKAGGNGGMSGYAGGGGLGGLGNQAGASAPTFTGGGGGGASAFGSQQLSGRGGDGRVVIHLYR